MKIDELRKVIRKLIKQEVREILPEEVSKAMGKVLVEMVREIKANNPSPAIVEETVEEPTVASIIHTKNPKLNSVLAETARNFRPLQKTLDAGLMELMEGGIEKTGADFPAAVNEGSESHIEPPATKLDFLKQMVGQSSNNESQPSALDGGAEVPPALKKVFKKDFRAVMKRIDEQKKGLAPAGYIDATKVLSG